MAHIISVRIC